MFTAYCPTLKNSQFECGNSACIKTCDNYKEPCRIIQKKCSNQCFCLPGYVFHKNQCIPIGKCPNNHDELY